MSDALVSVIIPTHDRAHLLLRTLKTVRDQTYPNMEILVVDDASRDDTESVVGNVSDPRVRYIRRTENGGAAAARNTGVAEAHGKYVAFLDSDDEWMPEKLRRQVAVADQMINPEFVVYSAVFVDTGNARFRLPARGKYVNEAVGDYVLANGGLIHTSTLLLPAEIMRRMPFSTRYPKHEDWDLFLRLEQRGVNWIYLQNPMAVWNNDVRPGRLTQLHHENSLGWLRDHRTALSQRAQHAFLVTEVASRLIAAQQQQFYALRLVANAVWHRAIAPRKAAKMFLRVVISRRLRRRIRCIVRRGQTQGTSN